MTFFYGFLYFVIRDYWAQQDPALREYDAQAIIDLCETRFCAGLEKFETLTIPVLPNIQALLIGVRSALRHCSFDSFNVFARPSKRKKNANSPSPGPSSPQQQPNATPSVSTANPHSPTNPAKPPTSNATSSGNSTCWIKTCL